MTLQYAFFPNGKTGATQRTGYDPLLTWAGSKNWLVPYVLPRFLKLLADGRVYTELFAGSLAIFVALRRAGWRGVGIVGDLNEALTDLYHDLQDDLADLIWAQLLILERDRLQDPKSHYHEVRALWNSEGQSGIKRSAWTIYLSLYGFNGIWRLNRRGKCNMAWGGEKKSKISHEALKEYAAALKNTAIYTGSYQEGLKLSPPGSLIYADPPYHTTDLEMYGGFWRDEDHAVLAGELCKAKDAGAPVVVSYNETPLISDLYREWRADKLKNRYQISCVAASRVERGEFLLWSR